MSHVKIGEWVFDNVEYDADRDVMYLSIGAPEPGYGEETPEGHILRYDLQDDFCGITLIGIRELLESGGEARVTVPPKPKQEPVSSTDIHRVLAAC